MQIAAAPRVGDLVQPVQDSIARFFEMLKSKYRDGLWFVRRIPYQDVTEPEGGYLIGVGRSLNQAETFIEKKSQRTRRVLSDGRVVFTALVSQTGSSGRRRSPKQFEFFKQGSWEACAGMIYIERRPVDSLSREERKELICEMVEF